MPFIWPPPTGCTASRQNLDSLKKSERSANGAEYESQGQARSEAARVAPGNRQSNVPALKGRNFLRISAFQALISGTYGNPGRRASRLPWAFILSRRWRSPSDF